MKIDISVESREALTKDILVMDYKILLTQIERLEEMRGKLPHQKEDLKNDKATAKAFKKILSYYMVYREYEELMNGGV